MFRLMPHWDSSVMTPEERKIYRAWGSIKQRCNNPNHAAFHHYGGRGINFHEAWATSLPAFAEAIGMPPSLRHDLDRKDVNKGYIPGNVRWLTHQENMMNTRSNVPVTINGVTKLASTWADEAGINRATFCCRMKAGFKGARLLMSPYDSRRTKITIEGVTKDLIDWAKEAGLTTTGMWLRLDHGEKGKDLLRPSRKGPRKKG